MNAKKFSPLKSGLTIIVLLAIISACIFIPKIASTDSNIDISTESSVAKLRANKSNQATGYCEKEADELRENILNAKNTEEYYEITGTKYYISASGDDNNDGLTPETPIKSLQRLSEIYMVDGDAVLFKRGDTFRFGESINVTNNVIYGSYGNGTKPKIYGSPENYAESDNWELAKENIWKISFNYPEASGVVINHSEIIGVNKYEGIKTLITNGDYFHDTDNNIFYLYCDEGNPCDVYEDIEIMPSFTLIKLPNSCYEIVIDNLCLKYSSGFAIHGVTPHRNLYITNCEIGFIGGKWVGEDHKLRYGNAIEFWNGAQDVTVKNNWIYQIYDSAFSWQGNAGGTYKNIFLSENLFEYNNADIEFFDRNGSEVENFRIENNIMRFTSMGWGTRTNDGGIRGIEGCIRAVTGTRGTDAKAIDIKSVYFLNNILDCPARQIINWNLDPEQKQYIHTSNTKLYINSEYRTLDACLQGLQEKAGDGYDRRFATTKQELIEMFPIFEENAQIYWDGE